MKKNFLTLFLFTAAIACGAYTYTQKARADEYKKRLEESELIIKNVTEQLRQQRVLAEKAYIESAIREDINNRKNKP